MARSGPSATSLTRGGRAAAYATPVARQGHTHPSSHHRGVSWSTKNQKWVATIQADGKKHHLGSFTDEEGAIVACTAAVGSLDSANNNI